MSDILTTTDGFASHILDDTLSPTLVNELRQNIAQPEYANRVVTSMMSILQRASLEPIEVVAAAMDRLEALAETDSIVACSLMVHLWTVACEVENAFDVCDAIDLWLGSIKDPSIDSQMKYVSETVDKPSIRQHFKRM